MPLEFRDSEQFFAKECFSATKRTDIICTILCPLPQYNTGFDYPNIVRFKNGK